jgi:hypothetical protein
MRQKVSPTLAWWESPTSAPAHRHSLAAAQATEILVCDIYHIEPIKDFI